MRRTPPERLQAVPSRISLDVDVLVEEHQGMNVHLIASATLLLMSTTVLAQDLAVVSTSPARAIVSADPSSSISITFDRPVDPTTIRLENFHAFSRGAGPLPGTFTISRDGRTITLDPVRDASPGEPVTVTLGNSIRAVDGSTLHKDQIARNNRMLRICISMVLGCPLIQIRLDLVKLFSKQICGHDQVTYPLIMRCAR